MLRQADHLGLKAGAEALADIGVLRHQRLSGSVRGVAEIQAHGAAVLGERSLQVDLLHVGFTFRKTGKQTETAAVRIGAAAYMDSEGSSEKTGLIFAKQNSDIQFA
ncbi:hypothetical protein ACQZ32_08210 [Ralstonia pseudosolanacearum]|uniref:hypothetical protein n=2 Tax=Ralstonia pseudosolanacearum TaxID=1310165 RepID=UPI0005C3D7C4|nr:hypothetical protein [Ralstonia pseudosolanacearum]MDC6293493.1 hypothetical protein [Ralstonia pseudosolanacearum]